MSSFAFKFAKYSFYKSDRARQEFYEDFAQAIRDGEGASVRLNKLVVRGKRDSDLRTPMFEVWLKRMRRVTFAESTAQCIPPYEVMVLTSAERDGKLAEAMDFLARSLSILGQIRSAYMMALISPLISFVVVLGMLITNSVEIAPIYLAIVPLNDWPSLPKAIYYMSELLVNRWFFVIPLLGAFYSLLSWSKDNWYGVVRSKVEKIPGLPWKKHRIRQGDYFLMTLALMLQSNSTGLKEALQSMKEFASPWLRWHLNQMSKRLVLTPSEPARALDNGLLQRSIMYRVEDFSERSNFEEGLKKMALDNGEYAVRKAHVKAVISSMIAIMLSAAFMLSFSIAQKQMGDQMQISMKRSK
jgi:hypothetical protein